MEVNPRQPKMTTVVAKSLINAVKSPDTDFDINNRGIVIVAKRFKFTPNQNLVSLDLGDDPQNYGILDGGHTYKAIIDNRDQIHSGLDKFVKLEIIVGEQLTVSRIADARNTSAQVSDIALFELDDKFDLIKDSLLNEQYASEIAYKDNDNKRIPISELIRLMFTFNIKRFPDDSTAPVSAYSGKQAVFKDYQKEFGTDKNIIKNITFYSKKDILKKYGDKAEKIVVDIDIDDAPFVALHLQEGHKIWTGDKILINGLKEKGYDICITTEELKKYLYRKE